MLLNKLSFSSSLILNVDGEIILFNNQTDKKNQVNPHNIDNNNHKENTLKVKKKRTLPKIKESAVQIV